MNKLTIPTLLLFIVAAVYIILLQIGCASCIPQKTRCSGNVAQICDSNGFWRDVIPCGDDAWECCWNTEANLHTCLLPEECAE